MNVDINELFRSRNNFFEGQQLWEIRKSEGCGQGLFANSNINEGELIFKDIPIVIGPRTSGQLPVCVTCLQVEKKLVKCSKDCHLPVCGEECANAISHEKECEFLRKVKIDESPWSPALYQILTPVRCLFMSERDKQIVRQLHRNGNGNVKKQMEEIKSLLGDFLSEEDLSWLEHCCGILDGTAFEIGRANSVVTWSLRGLYPLAAKMNHSCSPNTRHYYKNSDSGFFICVVATKPIAQNEEITTHYCPLLWATAPRRVFLETTKHFQCYCARCKDRTEFGTYLSAILCPCKGMIVPSNPLELSTDWKCQSCLQIISAKKAALAQSVAAKLPTKQMDLILPPNNSLKIQMKLQQILKLGKNDRGLTEDELEYKETLIRHVLEILNQLKLGESRMKGLMLSDLYKTLKEKKNRGIQVDGKDIEECLSRGKKILDNDDSAPLFEI